MGEQELRERITVDPDVMVGKPVIAGTRVPVALILRMLGQGIPDERILEEYPQLEAEDIQAAAAYAARVVDREEIFPLPAQDERIPA